MPEPGSDLAVDILISNHNYGRFLGAAIDSACSQNHPRVRVVVVDDGSTDDSRQRLRAYRGAVDIVLKEHGGQASAINAGFERSTGDVVILLDADDLLKPHAAAKAAAAFAAEPALARVQFRLEVIDGDGLPTGLEKPQPHIRMPNGDLRRAELMFPFDLSWPPTSGHAFRADALRRILPIPPGAYPGCGADWYVVHLSTLLGTVASFEEISGSYRVHGRNGYERADLRLDLEHVRQSIVYAAPTARALGRLADELGLERPDPILSVADVGNRLISRKLEPGRHPVDSDTVPKLVALALRAVRRRSDVTLAMKLIFTAWFLLTAASPRGLASRMAELYLFPERRRALNTSLRRLQRAPAPRPSRGATRA